MVKENQERDQTIAQLATNISLLTKMIVEDETKKGLSNDQGSSSLDSKIEWVLANQEKTDNSMKGLTEVVGSHTTSIQKLESHMIDLLREQYPKHRGQLSSNTIQNPKNSGCDLVDFNAITTQSQCLWKRYDLTEG
ncbi:hypothetical protein RND71_003349 [Anisodus tanguticus]|uniref:Uncharacterized protein n=1 Tax=Anisodus tanguticus TaxID=243964 RepID=A0AAE1ST46_9SOLA|nr:hypothetical protein RND71_003349 [Anisodus tanguticus]